jgi:outer membrane protein
MKKMSRKISTNKILMMIVIVNIGVSATLLALWMGGKGKTKTGYVNIGLVYDGFEYQKIKRKELESLSFSYKNTLDSIGLEIKYMEDALLQSYNESLAANLDRKKQNFFRLEENFTSDLEEAQAKSDQEVWQQINDYTQVYGKENGYEYIFGGNGSGSMMYAKEQKDLTDEVIAYINDKYSGE